MRSPLPDNIQPIAPEQFHQMHLPQWHLVLRIVLVALTLAYAYFVPARLGLVTYPVFLLGITLYAAAQSLLLLSVMFNRARPLLLHAITAVDIAGAVFILLNDPALLPPSLFLAGGLLALAMTLHRQRSFFVVYGVALVFCVAALILRQQLQDRPFDVPYVAFMLFALVASAATLILSAHAETLRLRAARVTETDPVTGLGNRWTFYEAAKYLLPYHQRNMTPMVVMFAEIEIAPRKGKRVTRVINQYLLKQFASIVDRRLRGADIAVHYGGNEFAFLLVDTTTKDAESIAFDIQQQFDTWAKQKDLSSYVHIGLSVVPNRPVALDQILMNINSALYRARQYKKGVSGAVFADPEQTR